ncbi:MAG TPA: hypothetical protein VHZ09_10540 [Acidobacteriaceae bacterium]|jgi:hypothetical protein|nr:hypothetical protein [Acidobacteriaceae bacterium]
MSTTKLLETLLTIERSIGRAENSALRNLLMDAQTEVLLLQKDAIRLLEEVQQLRERRETHTASASWHAVAQVLAAGQAEKESSRAAGPVAVEDRAS